MVEITITLTLKSPLTIGSGAQQGTLAQRGLLKDPAGWPYVPASSLKGRLRHAVEQIVRATDTEQTVLDPHENRRRLPTDVVTRLFGAPWVRGQVLFEDLLLSGPPAIIAYRNHHLQAPLTQQRTGVSINRGRHVAEDQRLYSTELFQPGVPLEFQGKLRGNLLLPEVGWLVAGLHLLPALGRSKSTGLGWLDIATQTTLDGQILPSEKLRQALQETS